MALGSSAILTTFCSGFGKAANKSGAELTKRLRRLSKPLKTIVTRLPKNVLASVKKRSFEKSNLPSNQAFSGFPPEKSSFWSKYF